MRRNKPNTLLSMKKILLVLLATGLTLYACKKDDKTNTTTPPPPDEVKPVNTKDPQAMTAAIKVFYGTNTKGTLPAPTGTGAPVLKASNKTITTANGYYAVINPEITSGTVAGYYLQINGADSYFKIDYSKTRGARKAQTVSKHNEGIFRELGDNSDSLIVIKLPENATLDTFCITYVAYDSLNHVSDPISDCIAIIPVGGGTESAALVGTWSFTRSKYGDEDWTSDYYTPDTIYSGIRCDNDTLAYCGGTSDCRTVISSHYWKTKLELVLAADGKLTNVYEDKSYRLDMHSSCTDPTYLDVSLSYNVYGVWSYNPTTKTLILILTGEDSANPESYNVQSVQLSELSATKMVMYGANDPTYLTEYTKK